MDASVGESTGWQLGVKPVLLLVCMEFPALVFRVCRCMLVMVNLQDLVYVRSLVKALHAAECGQSLASSLSRLVFSVNLGDCNDHLLLVISCRWF